MSSMGAFQSKLMRCTDKWWWYIHCDYNELWDYCQSFINKYENYQNSLYGVVSQIISDIPEKLGSAMDELARLDMSKLQNVFQEISETGGNSGALMQSVFGKDKNK